MSADAAPADTRRPTQHDAEREWSNLSRLRIELRLVQRELAGAQIRLAAALDAERRLRVQLSAAELSRDTWRRLAIDGPRPAGHTSEVPR